MSRVRACWSVLLLITVCFASVLSQSIVSAVAQSEVSVERKVELDRLFRELEIAQTVADANGLTDRIWAIWLQSGDPVVDDGMRNAIAAMNTQRFPVAIAILDALVAQAPNYAEAWNKRATVHYLMGRHDESLEDIEATLALEPRHFGALSGKALVLTARGDKAGALAAIEAALKVNPFSKGAKRIIEENGGVYRPRQPI